ncbi:MAG: sigma-54-dependent Fis family transcriptional regulator [Desulfobacterales bacterium]|jgi:DNA-binding NtrC family response regulator|nr:sigma-54-dependent Fis family transcriptional regulator [Desulfobacterales bacterium]
MISYTIFIIDDEKIIRDGLTMALEGDYEIRTFSNAEAALEIITNSLPDLILLDIGLPGISGIDALGKIKEIFPYIPVIMITAYEDINTVISAMKLGAYDYVVKPIQMNGLEVTIKNAIETIRLRKEVCILQEKHLKENLPCFIGKSNTVQDMMEFIEVVAKSPDTPVFIMGETGTGKELIARSIHYRSPNFGGNFVTVNCAAIPKELIESEIFGYEKGAFSGASISGKKGLIEDSARGTLFLDEIGDLNLEAQAKFLRFLEEGEYYKVGGTKKHYIQTRIVSATNKDIDKMIEDGLFRKDLYFRIGVIKINVPSLNERQDDIIHISNYFINKFNKKFDKNFKGISTQGENALMNHNWTGNVRELKNIIEKSVLIGKGNELTENHLGFDTPKILDQQKNKIGFLPIPPEGIDLSSVQKSMEIYYINEAYRIAEGNESKAAKLLNINHHTFRYRRKKIQ